MSRKERFFSERLPEEICAEAYAFLHTFKFVWKKRNERPNVGGVFSTSRNGAPS